MHSFSLIATALLATVATATPITKRQVGANGTDPRTNNNALVSSLITIPTAAERLNLLNPADLIYDFGLAQGNTSNTVGNGGRTVKADRGTFPALVGTGVSMTLGFLGPCGFNTPHTHPRGTEFNVVVQGALQAESQLENGAPNFQANLTQYQATVFPQGAIHTEFNPLCTESIFVAGFNSEDPGVQQVAQTFFSFRPDLVQAVLGGDGTVNGEDLEAFRATIPRNVALGVESCLRTCGIQKK